jgi:peptide/nickel transport system ATP-binding protein
MSAPVLAMEGVGVALRRAERMVPVLEDFSLSVEGGEVLALVGESGSGKSIAGLSVPRLLPARARLSGRIRLGGEDLTGATEAAMRRVRGARIGMVFQDPLAALNPLMRVGAQIAEPIVLHERVGREAAWARAVSLLEEVGIERPAARARDYPHQFSGGMRQRVTIAAALACGPELLIADEPVTGLDPLNAQQIFALLARLRSERRMAVLLISHDLASVRRHADAVQVLYAGRTAERGRAEAVFATPRHPYTRALLAAAPVLGVAPVGIGGQLPEPEAREDGCRFAPRCLFAAPECAQGAPPMVLGATEAACRFPRAGPMEQAASDDAAGTRIGAQTLLRAEGLSVRYAAGFWRARTVTLALDDANFALGEGECLAVVGASGSGKTSLGRAALQMLPYEGTVRLRDVVLGTLRGAARRRARRRLGVVFQDPAASLNPAMDVEALIGEALRLGGERNRAARRRRAAALLESVGLPEALLGRFPGTLSGGQAQRVAIARALAAEPDLLVFDEPTASLDVSTQAVVLNLLRHLAASRGLAYIVITHDLAAVGFLAHRVAVLHRGRIVDVQDTASMLRNPLHPHSAALVQAARAGGVCANAA